MSKKFKEFLKINKNIISGVYVFSSSSGEKNIYIFFKGQGWIKPELLLEACEEDDGATEFHALPAVKNLEETMRGCVGNRIEI